MNAVVADLELHAPDIWGRSVGSVFFGGGTPSLMSAAGMEFLMSRIRSIVKLEPNAEITLEANPGAINQDRFSAYQQAGVNRLSIGVQSFNPIHLQALGRIHSSDDAANAVVSARQAGFENFNLDLMHGLPGQTARHACDDINAALELAPSHISYYQLTLEPNTLFAARPPELPGEETLWDIQQQGKQLLADAGYRQYEVSAYARDNRQCQHNLNYWLFGDYLGIGAGAHSKLTFPAHNSIVRHSKRKQPADYMRTADTPDRIQGQRELGLDDTRLEFMMNALRLNDGFQTADFLSRTGEDIDPLKATIDTLETDGLLTRTPFSVAPTDNGLRYLDSVLEKFLPDAADNSYATKETRVIPIINSDHSA
ncbi:YggW family oxidoreductase [Chromatiales bacterium (ex Bugula neritina AB1)]|nr:YggW family oxidoreductase [Chromatiales bacterium (ex Bugula neritina AB1)]